MFNILMMSYSCLTSILHKKEDFSLNSDYINRSSAVNWSDQLTALIELTVSDRH